MLDPDYSPEEEDRFARGLRNSILPSLALWGVIIAAGVAMCASANAQTANAGAQSASGAQAAAGSQAGSAAIIQQTFTGPSEQRVIQGGGTNSTLTYSGGYQQNYRATIRNTPDAYAPPVTGGTNPCQQGLSGGGSVAGFGVALGGSWSDPQCERRNLSALLHNQGQHALAQEVLCETESVRQARLRLGQPCAADVAAAQARAVPAGTPIVTPAAAAPREVVGGGSTPVAFTRPAWCETASAAELRRYRSTCG
jgi:hypothetical protein